MFEKILTNAWATLGPCICIVLRLCLLAGWREVDLACQISWLLMWLSAVCVCADSWLVTRSHLTSELLRLIPSLYTISVPYPIEAEANLVHYPSALACLPFDLNPGWGRVQIQLARGVRFSGLIDNTHHVAGGVSLICLIIWALQ